MKSYVVEAHIETPSVSSVVDAENEQEAERKAVELLKQKLKLVPVKVRTEVRSELTPTPEKVDHLLP